MKLSFLSFLCFSFIAAFGQNTISETSRIASSEMKSAEREMNMVVNTNTLNYDISYHKLEFTVDPANYFISGKITTTYTALTNMTTLIFDLSKFLRIH